MSNTARRTNQPVEFSSRFDWGHPASGVVTSVAGQATWRDICHYAAMSSPTSTVAPSDSTVGVAATTDARARMRSAAF